MGLKRKTRNAIIWNGINQSGRFGIRFIVTLFLARLLIPEDFGLISMIMVVTSLSDVFIDSGFKMGIIQKKSLHQNELSSIFLINVLIGIALTVIIYTLAPFLGNLYNEPRLNALTKAIAFLYFFNSLSIVQQGILSREMDFKKQTIAQVGAQGIAGIVAIYCAYKGLGVWSLVANVLLNSLLSAILFWGLSRWRPTLNLVISDVGEIWRFSSNLLVTNLLVVIGNKIDVFFIGKYFSPQTVGFYSKSKDFALLPSQIGNAVINSSLYPAFAKLQDQQEKFSYVYIRTLRVLVMVFSPIAGIMFSCADEIILILLGEKWLDSVIYFKWSAIIGFLYIITGLMTYVINAKGRSDLNLKRTMVQAPLRILMFITLPFIIPIFDPIYYVYTYILFFFSACIVSHFWILKLCSLDLKKNYIVGLQYISVVILSIIILHAFEIPNVYVSIVIKSSIMIVLYCLILFGLKDRLFQAAVLSLKQTLKNVAHTR